MNFRIYDLIKYLLGMILCGGGVFGWNWEGFFCVVLREYFL